MNAESDGPYSTYPTPWALPREYSLGGGSWLTKTYQALSCALHPILGETGRTQVQDLPEPEDSVPLSHQQDEDPSPGSDLSSPLYRGIHLQATWTTSTDEVLNFDVDNLLTNINRMADEMGGQLVKAMIEHISEICESTGNTIDASGRDFYETIIATAETMQLAFDANGKLLTKILASEGQHLELANKLPTADQEARLKVVIDSKREEWNAARRRRELP